LCFQFSLDPRGAERRASTYRQRDTLRGFVFFVFFVIFVFFVLPAKPARGSRGSVTVAAAHFPHELQDPHPSLPHPPGPVGLLHPQPPSSAQPPCFTPCPFGSSYRKQHFSRPHMPESLDGFRLRLCCFAILMEIGANDCSQVVQHSGRPQEP
jgi:hypothetical protein